MPVWCTTKGQKRPPHCERVVEISAFANRYANSPRVSLKIIDLLIVFNSINELALVGCLRCATYNLLV